MQSYEFNDTKLVLDINIIQKYVDYITEQVKLSKLSIIKAFFVTLQNTANVVFLTSLFSKELVSLIVEYNSEEIDYHIDFDIRHSQHIELYTYEPSKYTNLQTISYVMKCRIDDFIISKVNLYKHDGIIVMNHNMICLSYIIKNGMFKSFVAMNYDELYLACAQVSRDVFKIENYPTFFILMHKIITTKKYHHAIIASIVYDMIENKLKPSKDHVGPLSHYHTKN